MPDPPAPPKPPARFDLHVIFETLRGGKANDAWLREWLYASFDTPDQFREALYVYAGARRRGMRSRLDTAYDLYNDCVVAHLGAGKAAFLAGGPQGTLEEVSYDTLNDRCTMLSAAWRRAGVEPGASVVVALPLGVDHVVALLTALRMGLVVTTLTPYGPSFVRTRLAALEPDRIVATEHLCNLLGLPADRTLPATAKREIGVPSAHAYAPKEVALRLFSPFSAPDDDPIEVTAAGLHESIVRDGIVVLGLDPTDVVAAPGFDAMQVQPHLLLSVLAAGACYADLSLKELERDPKLLERAKVTVLGIGRALREQILARGLDPLKASVRTWFRDLTEVVEIHRWDEFGRLVAGSKLTGFNVVMNAATGGTELWSPRSTSSLTLLRVWPIPARSWQLSEVAAGALPMLNESGIYTVVVKKKPMPGLPELLLARQGEGFLFAGCVALPGPRAQVFPGAEVAAVAAQIPAVRHAAVVLAPGQWMNDVRVVLLVFVDDARGPDGRIALPVGVPELKSRIAREMGERFMPERIEILPLRPRFTKEGEIDHAWCRSQYLSGTLTQKARSEMFILLSRLGYILAGGERPE
jgi:AMP-binding enzyme